MEKQITYEEERRRDEQLATAEAAVAAAELVVRGPRVRAAGALLPPGVFPSRLARLARRLDLGARR